jgi:hypothetical protein
MSAFKFLTMVAFNGCSIHCQQHTLQMRMLVKRHAVAAVQAVTAHHVKTHTGDAASATMSTNYT